MGFKLRGRIGCTRCIGVRSDMGFEGYRGYAKQLISHVATCLKMRGSMS